MVGTALQPVCSRLSLSQKVKFKFLTCGMQVLFPKQILVHTCCFEHWITQPKSKAGLKLHLKKKNYYFFFFSKPIHQIWLIEADLPVAIPISPYFWSHFANRRLLCCLTKKTCSRSSVRRSPVTSPSPRAAVFLPSDEWVLVPSCPPLLSVVPERPGGCLLLVANSAATLLPSLKHSTCSYPLWWPWPCRHYL